MSTEFDEEALRKARIDEKLDKIEDERISREQKRRLNEIMIKREGRDWKQTTGLSFAGAARLIWGGVKKIQVKRY